MFQHEMTGNKFIFFIITGLFAVMLVSGCGHRGDLTLPDATETSKQKKKAS